MKAAQQTPLTGVETILLVEDEARVRKLIVDVLTARGYRVLEATRGEEALRVAKLHSGSIELVLASDDLGDRHAGPLVRMHGSNIPFCHAGNQEPF